MSELDAQIADRAIKVVRQLAYVAVERGALATDLGFELDAAAEKELGRRFHQLAGQAWHVFGLCDRQDALLADLKAKTAAEEQAGEEAPDPWAGPSKPSVLEAFNRFTRDQRAGSACLICADDFSEHFGRPSAIINGHHMNVHVDPNVCTRVLAERISKEVPF